MWETQKCKITGKDFLVKIKTPSHQKINQKL